MDDYVDLLIKQEEKDNAMKTLKDINLCTHPNASDCFYYLFLAYKQQGTNIMLPDGHPPCPCEHCQWLNRGEWFFTPKSEGEED